MAADLRSLLAYHHALWRRLADFYVDECTWEQLARNHETSHQTIANVTMHAVNMEDWWLHYMLPGKAWDGPAWDGFQDARSMRERIQEVEKKTDGLLDAMTPEERARKRTVRVGDEKKELSVDDILAEVLSEGMHHRGEVLAMFWRMDKQPPFFGYSEWLSSR